MERTGLRVLYIGGSGEISAACVIAAASAGHQVSVFNRGHSSGVLPAGVEQIVGERNDSRAVHALAARNFDVVCQFLTFEADEAAMDIGAFAGHCRQFIFISTASVYQKPITTLPITEASPVGNIFSQYSQRKLDCEQLYRAAHDAGRVPVTIVRPSHTYRQRLPSTVITGDHLAWRLRSGKPVPVHGDGQSAWTLTHASDFARAFVALCGNDRALGQTINLTGNLAYSWNHILGTVAHVIGVVPDIRPILSRTIEAAFPAMVANLSGDKANSLIFDTQRLHSLVPGWQCEVALDAGIRLAWGMTATRLANGFQPDPLLDAKIDALIQQARNESGSR